MYPISKDCLCPLLQMNKNLLLSYASNVRSTRELCMYLVDICRFISSQLQRQTLHCICIVCSQPDDIVSVSIFFCGLKLFMPNFKKLGKIIKRIFLLFFSSKNVKVISQYTTYDFSFKLFLKKCFLFHQFSKKLDIRVSRMEMVDLVAKITEIVCTF